MKLISAVLSKPAGKGVNQDAIGSLPAESGLNCWVLADGRSPMAAQRTVQAILGNFAANPAISQPVLARALEMAQFKVLELHSLQEYHLSNSAAVAVFCAGGLSAYWGHVGNVRVYVFRNGEIIAQTKDHSISQALVDGGKLKAMELRGHKDRHALLRSLGTPTGMYPTILENRFKILPEDLFLLCSDGFWEYVTELEMQAEWCKSTSLEDWLERMEMRILLAAPSDHDTYSAIALLAKH